MSQRNRARLEVAGAALLWSLSGGFTKALTKPTAFALDVPPIDSMQIAFFRVLFAGMCFAPSLRSGPWRPSKPVVFMVALFAIMNVLFITSMHVGTAANAILLQYTAPLWVLIGGGLWLGERVDRRDLGLLAGGLTGIAIIIAGNWAGGNNLAVLLALGSGLTYAGVLLMLRRLNDRSPARLTALNQLGSAAVLLPVLFLFPAPSWQQLAVLVVFGAVQLALPYWIMARALKHIPPFEAGLLTLLEPVLNPLWAYLVSPATEMPSTATLIGGAIILGALAWRYSPVGKRNRGGEPASAAPVIVNRDSD